MKRQAPQIITGRRRSNISYAIYAVGGVASAGVGAAGARVVLFAMIRDAYEGDEMSHAMSNVMAVFILVPIVAPTLGAGIVAIIFGGLAAVMGIAMPSGRGESLTPCS